MKKIIIIGGGTAGWLTALIVNKFWENTNVTLVESSKIGILGAGEGSTPNFGRILSLLGINQKDFYEKTGATNKRGLNLINWLGDGSTAKHLFTGEEPTVFTKSFGYHFDARKVADYFKQIAIDRGVNWIDGEIETINNTGEFIKSFKLVDDRIISSDFVFDCSGFNRLVGNLFNEEWVDYSKYLMINSSIAFFLPQNKKLTIKDKTYTNMVAMSCGWMWQIELQHRWGCGYSFNKDYITVEDAKKEVEDYLGHEIEIQKVFSYNPGRYKRSWIGNSISIGLSYGFIEPLEATSLMSTIMQLKRLVDKNFDENYKDEFNKWCEEINEQNMMFIRYHYLAERLDNKFWIDAYNKPIPKKLKQILDKDNNIIIKNDIDLLKSFDLVETPQNMLAFFTHNYQTIFRKNKKVLKKELI